MSHMSSNQKVPAQLDEAKKSKNRTTKGIVSQKERIVNIDSGPNGPHNGLDEQTSSGK